MTDLDPLATRIAEFADVQIYLIQIAARLGVDIERAVLDKLDKNEKKYPAP